MLLNNWYNITSTSMKQWWRLLHWFVHQRCTCVCCLSESVCLWKDPVAYVYCQEEVPREEEKYWIRAVPWSYCHYVGRHHRHNSRTSPVQQRWVFSLTGRHQLRRIAPGHRRQTNSIGQHETSHSNHTPNRNLEIVSKCYENIEKSQRTTSQHNEMISCKFLNCVNSYHTCHQLNSIDDRWRHICVWGFEKLHHLSCVYDYVGLSAELSQHCQMQTWEIFTVVHFYLFVG